MYKEDEKMSATWFTGRIPINGKYAQVPIGYFNKYPGTKEPYATTGSGSNMRISNIDIETTIAYEDVEPKALNKQSPLWIYYGNDFCGAWKEVYDANENIERTVIVLGNGNYITAQKASGDPNLTIRVRDHITHGTQTTLYVGNFSAASAHYIGITFVESNVMNCACFLIMDILRNSSHVSEYRLRSLTGSAYDTSFFADMREIDTNDPYGTNTDNTPEGGFGDFNYTSEVEVPPQLPSLSAAQVGFVSLWNPTQAEMQALANYLWTGTFDLTNFKKLFTDPMECVLSVGLIPITPAHEESKREIVFGGSSHSGVNAFAVTDQFYIIDMGTLHIKGMSQGALDYSPYAKASIYLPYCGTYALDVDEIMDSDISLEYHIDIYTGACVAYLTINGHLNSDGHNVNAIMYQFTGNVLASIPITGNDHSQFIQSMLFMGAAAAATVATSGAGAGAAASSGADLGAETAAAGFNKALAGSAVNTVMSMKPNVLHSGNLSSTAGMLGGQKPFITMTWSNLCRPEDEYKLVGIPLHKSGTLSDFSGFTIVSACHLDNILCTDAELLMIEQALAKGVII